MSFIEDFGVQIRGHLQREQNRINAEIGHYPAPIAGCDQQFNHLLAQRAALKEELARLATLEENALTAGDAAGLLAEFIRTSTGLDAEAKATLGRRLQAGTDRR